MSDAKLWNRVPPRSGRIPTDKIGAVWNTLQGLRQAPERTVISRTLADITCFLLLTGCRWNEAAQLRWTEVDTDEGWWHLGDPKNRQPVTFPLSEAAREILEARDRKTDYVFPGRTGKKGYIGESRGVMEKVSQIAGVHLTPHDCRRTFRAIAGECGIELWRTKLLMNHKLTADVTINSYTETSDLRYLAPDANKIADWIRQQAAIAASEKVVQMPRKSA